MILPAHSGIRYLVLLFGLLVVGYALRGVVTRAPYDSRMRVFGGLFAVSLDLNIFLGLGAMFARSAQLQIGGHIITMLFAAGVAHVVPSVMKRRPMEERTYMPHLVSGVIAMALVIAGILSLPGGRILGSYTF